jgi:O-antigen/teichoic acid export membrane protein
VIYYPIVTNQLEGFTLGTARHYLVNVFAQIGGRIFSMGASFLIFVLIARIMGTGSLGQLASVMAFVLIAGNIADMGTMAALARDLVLEKENGAETYFGNFLILRAVLAILAIVIAVPVVSIVAPDLTDLILMTSLAIPFVGSRFLETVYQVYNKPQYTVYSSAFLAVVQLGIALPLLLWFKVDLLGYLAGYVVTQIAYFAFSIFLATRLISPRFILKIPVIQATIGLAAPMGLWSLFNAVSSRLDIFMLNHWRSTEEAGLYNAAYRLIDLSIILAAAAAVPLVPVLSKLLTEKGYIAKIYCRKLFEATVVVLLPVPVILFYIAEELVLLLYGEEYLPAAEVLRIFSVLFVLSISMYIASAINLASDNIHYSWWSAAVALVINAGANFYFIPELGIIGAAYATIASTVFMASVSFYFVHKSLSGTLELKIWFRIMVTIISMSTAIFLMPFDSVLLSVFCLTGLYMLLVWRLRLLDFELIKQFR